ncbi:MAG: type VI secretion system secreted protein Hcp [Verrucomicrobiales bacterium]|jgi:type VI secretion system secreted protein Hcp
MKTRHSTIILPVIGCIALFCSFVSSASAQVDMFLKIEGIKGESKDATHGEEVDILAWSWGSSQSGTTHFGGGGGAGRVNVQDLSFSKWVDKASAGLLERVFDGKHIPKATLTVRKAGANPLEYITIEFYDIIVTAVSTGGSGGEERLTENVTLNFSKVKFTYHEQKEDGSQGAEHSFGWDIAANVKA